MKDDFIKRHNMHLAILRLLEFPEYFPVWKDQPPRAFGVMVSGLRPAVDALGLLLSQPHAAEDQDCGQAELEVTACEIGQTLAFWLESQGRAVDAARIDFPLIHWQSLHDAQLIAKARLLRRMLILAISTDGDRLMDYDLTADDAITLADGILDFETATLTGQLRSLYREVSEILTGLDRLVLRYRRTKAGRCFADAWQAARKTTVEDLRGGAEEVVLPVCYLA